MAIAKHAKTQQELEQISHDDYRRKVLTTEQQAALKNYTSSTVYGQALLRGQTRATGAPALNPMAVMPALIAAKLEDDRVRPGPKVVRGMILAAADQIKLAMEASSSYGGNTKNPLDLLAVITLKAVVDGIGGTGNGKWPAANELVGRIGEAVDMQRIDALCICLDPDEHARQAQRWNRKHQGVTNRRTNQMLGQRDLLARVDLDRHALIWSNGDRVDVGSWLLDIVVQHLSLVEVYQENRSERDRNPPKRIRPLATLLEQFPAFLEQLSRGQLICRPLIEPPLLWVLDEGPGRLNCSGGYHQPAHRQSHPLVRSRFGNNDSRPSQLAIALANTLGAVTFRPDTDMADAFAWAVVNNKVDVDGIAPRPLETYWDLERETAELNAYYAETGGEHPLGLVRGTEAHNAWRTQRKLRYNAAIDGEQRFIRTREALLASKTLTEFERIWYSWTFDSRGRIYPTQQLLTPQGSHMERTLIRFAEGEHLSPQGEDAALAAIAVAAVGNKISLAARVAWGRANIKELLDATAEGDPADIALLSSQGRDEPWDLLQLLRAAHRTFRQGLPWDVGVSADASSSAIQILGGLLRDPKTLIATNALVVEGEADTGPRDAYGLVGATAKRLMAANLLELGTFAPPALVESIQNFTPLARVWATRFVNHDGSRGLFKKVVMPLAYGLTERGAQDAVREWLADQKIELSAEVGDQFEGQIVVATAKVVMGAAGIVFPAALATLGWLTKLGSLSLAQQRKAGCNLPELAWTLSDGFVVSYHKSQSKTKRVKTLTVGELRVEIGAGTNTDDRATVTSMPPNLVHSLDGLILRLALDGWKGPVTCLHDCIAVHPNTYGAMQQRINRAYITTISDNPLSGIADQMGITEEQLPRLPLGTANLEDVMKARYLYH